MGRRLSDRGAYARDAIGTILSKAKEPLDSVEIAQDPLLADMEFTSSAVAEVLCKMHAKGKQSFPLKRIHAAGTRNARWKYYNPEFVQPLEDRPRGKRPAVAPEPTPTPPPPPPEFTFDPLPMVKELEQKPTVEVPPGVRSITVKVGGVSILIELDASAVAR